MNPPPNIETFGKRRTWSRVESERNLAARRAVLVVVDLGCLGAWVLWEERFGRGELVHHHLRSRGRKKVEGEK